MIINEFLGGALVGVMIFERHSDSFSKVATTRQLELVCRLFSGVHALERGMYFVHRIAMRGVGDDGEMMKDR